MLLNNEFLKKTLLPILTNTKKNDSNTIEFFIGSLLLQKKIISLGSLKRKVIQVDKTEKMNEEMLFKDVYCNQLIFN